MPNLEMMKVVLGYIVGTLGFAACLWFGWTGPNPTLQLLFCLFGGALGWIIGILITPLDDGEKKQFSDYAKAISTLASGFALGKVDSLIAAVGGWQGVDRSLGLTRALLFCVCFLIALLFTFIGRRYIRAPEQVLREMRLKHIEEIEQTLAKLARIE